jgi:tetratricopeptide (TPR) repeat protein
LSKTRWKSLAVHFPFILLFILGAGSSLRAQDSKPADYSKEAFVIEQKTVKETFQSDGTYSVDTSARIRVQSQAGLQAFGVLNFPYASAISNVDVTYVRVIKPDQRVVTTPEENILDMPAEITREAPFYSDLKTKQVAVKGLEAGDILEFAWHAQVFKPLDPEQFWTTYDFIKEGVALEENLEIRVPRGRYVKVSSPKFRPKESDDGSVHVYSWRTSHLTSAEPASDDADNSGGSDVQLTSFRNWDEMGEWIHSLFAPKAVPSPEIQAKATELTKNAKTDADKIQAIYKFVSSQYHYIGIDFGIGRIQPHDAADVLTNQYGDCKDKHTLFAALLAAVGIKAYPALISTTSKIDPDMPSPAQFDHVITAIPQAQGFLFLDTTPEVAPYGFLLASLRDKKALVVPDSGSPTLVATAPDPPFPSYFTFRADGKLDDDGTLESKMQMTFRGDVELIYRMALRQSAQPQWKDVMQRVSSNFGFGGTVSDVTATSPDDTTVPFHIEYQYSRKEYSDWANKRIGPPFPPVFLPPAPDESEAHPKPIELGAPGEMKYDASIVLPSGADPQIPPDVNLSEGFADYHAKYSYSGGYFKAERDLVTKVRKVDPAQFAAYRAFEKAVQDDVTTYIPLFRSSWATTNDTVGTPEARALYERGAESWAQQNLAGAADLFQQSVQKDPKFARGWMALGGAEFQLSDIDKAVEDWKKAATLDPTSISDGSMVLPMLMFSNRTNDAIEIWRIVEKGEPDNPDVHDALGNLYSKQRRYAEAIPEYEKAREGKPNDATLLEMLGEAYVRDNQQEKGVADMEKALTLDTSEFMNNLVAYDFAEDNIHLDEALKYAQTAVSEEEDSTTKISIDSLKVTDLRMMLDLSANWDTLGWVQFRLGHYDQAVTYLNAAWLLSQFPASADHLGQAYEKQGKKRDAIIAYQYAIDTHHAPNGTKERLDALRAQGSVPQRALADSPSPQDLRSFKIAHFPGKPKEHASAEFFLLFEPGPKLTSVKFISGSDELRNASAALQSANMAVLFPDDHPAKILRRALLDCEPEIPGCVVAFIPIESVDSLN